MDLPSSRGCRTASERRLTTVSRPFTSADTAYMVVSLHSKKKDASNMQKLYLHTLQQKKGLVIIWKVAIHTVRVHCDKGYIPWCLAVTDSSVFFQRKENFIFTPVLSGGLKIGRTRVDITSHKTTSLTFHFVVFTSFTYRKGQFLYEVCYSTWVLCFMSRSRIY